MPNRRVALLIDDSLDDRQVISRHLLRDRQWRYEIIEASSGAKGIELALSRELDVIVLDQHLGDTTGTNVLTALRSKGHSSVPILFLTGSRSPLDEEISPLELGADDYLNKEEISGAHLRRAVSNAITKSRMRVELERSEANLRQALGELERRIEFEERLIGVVSHDLRTPLSAFQLGLELLVEEDLSESARAVTQRLSRTTGTMTAIVEQLLNLTRIRASDSFPLEVRRTSIEEVTEQSLRGIGDQFPDRMILLNVTAEGSFDVDKSAFTQLATNLVANAARHGKPGPISITLASDAGNIHLIVENQGAIREELAKTLFEPFVRRNQSRGLGLGLYIVKSIADGHGGSVHAKSDDEVTAFTVTLPRKRAD